MEIEKIVSDFQMLGSRIKSFHMDNDFVRINSNRNIEKEIDTSYTTKSPMQFQDDENAPIAGLVTLMINIRVFDDEYEARLSLETEGCFILKNSYDEKELEDMLAVNGTAALYSLARGFLSSVTSQMCMNGTITIPMVNTVELRHAEINE